VGHCVWGWEDHMDARRCLRRQATINRSMFLFFFVGVAYMGERLLVSLRVCLFSFCDVWCSLVLFFVLL